MDERPEQLPPPVDFENLRPHEERLLANTLAAACGRPGASFGLGDFAGGPSRLERLEACYADLIAEAERLADESFLRWGKLGEDERDALRSLLEGKADCRPGIGEALMRRELATGWPVATGGSAASPFVWWMVQTKLQRCVSRLLLNEPIRTSDLSDGAAL